MYNNDLVCLAGKPEKWDDEVDKATSLAEIQKDQWNRGRRVAILYKVDRGWSVRLNPCFGGDIVLYDTLYKDDAITFGKEWAGKDPENKSFHIYKDHMVKDNV